MSEATLDGIRTRYEVIGDGPPILMYSPGGFDATLDKWSTLHVYKSVRILDHLAEKYRCIIFDRRETGRSGGRIEEITWDDYVAQGKGLLEHLGLRAAHVLGGCMGCSPAAAFGVKHPTSTLSLVLYWPVGGTGFRDRAQERFAEHLTLVDQEGLNGVVRLVKTTEAGFGKDPRVGPWAPVIRSDPEFAARYASFDPDQYKRIVAAMSRTMFEGDTPPGVHSADLAQLKIPTLIIPGNDAVHTKPAARYFASNLPRAEYWDVEPEAQTESTVIARLLAFLDRDSGATSGAGSYPVSP